MVVINKIIFADLDKLNLKVVKQFDHVTTVSFFILEEISKNKIGMKGFQAQFNVPFPQFFWAKSL